MSDDDEEEREPTNREWALSQLAGAAGWSCPRLAREEDLQNLFVCFDGLASKAALKRKEEILGLLRWKYATDPFFSISSKIRLRLAADGSCQVVCGEGGACGASGPELLCSTRAVDVPMETALPRKKGGHVFNAPAIAERVLEAVKAESVVVVDVEILFPVSTDEEGCRLALRSYVGILRALCDGHEHSEQYYFKTWPKPAHGEASSAVFWDEAAVDRLRGTSAHSLVTAGKGQLDRVAAIVENVIAEDYPVPLDLSKTACATVGDLFKYVVLTFESRAFSEALDEEIGATPPADVKDARAAAADDTEAGKPPEVADLMAMLAGVGRAPEVKRRNRVCVPLVDLFDGAPTGRHNASTQRNTVTSPDGEATAVITMTTSTKIAAGKDIFNAYGPNGGATMLFKYGFVPWGDGRHDGGPSLEAALVCPGTAVYENLDHMQQYGLELKGYTRERICTYGWRLGDPALGEEPEMFAKFATLVLASENPEIFDMEDELPRYRVGAAMLRLLRDQLAEFSSTADDDVAALDDASLPPEAACAGRVRLLERNVLLRWAKRIADRYDCDEDELAAFDLETQTTWSPCAHCGWALRTVLCSRCKATSFCSNACLKAAWPDHKKTCRKQKKGE